MHLWRPQFKAVNHGPEPKCRHVARAGWLRASMAADRGANPVVHSRTRQTSAVTWRRQLGGPGLLSTDVSIQIVELLWELTVADTVLASRLTSPLPSSLAIRADLLRMKRQAVQSSLKRTRPRSNSEARSRGTPKKGHAGVALLCSLSSELLLVRFSTAARHQKATIPFKEWAYRGLTGAPSGIRHGQQPRHPKIGRRYDFRVRKERRK